MRMEMRRTRALFDRGEPLAAHVGFRFVFQVRLAAAGGKSLLDRIEAAGCDVVTRRPKLTRSDRGKLPLETAAPGRSPTSAP